MNETWWVLDGGLAFEDMTDPPPEGAIICEACLGWGRISTIQNWEDVAEDCPDCDCNGWVMPKTAPNNE